MKIKTCPQCGSRDIHLYMGAELGIQYKCKTCNYIGALIVEKDVEKRFKK